MPGYSLLLAVLVSSASHADDNEFGVNATGIPGYGIFEVSGSAPGIWHGDVLLMRKTFTIEKVPQLSVVDDD